MKELPEPEEPPSWLGNSTTPNPSLTNTLRHSPVHMSRPWVAIHSDKTRDEFDPEPWPGENSASDRVAYIFEFVDY